jgi:hypothetical protein
VAFLPNSVLSCPSIVTVFMLYIFWTAKVGESN